MGDEIRITYEMKSDIVKKISLRALLFAILCITIGFGYLRLGHPQSKEIAFFISICFALFLIIVAILYPARHSRGAFGSDEDDRRLIAAWLEETNHWWGKPLTRKSLTVSH